MPTVPLPQSAEPPVIVPRARPLDDDAPTPRLRLPAVVWRMARRMSGFSTSLIVHAALLVGLAMITYALPLNRLGAVLSFVVHPAEAAVESLVPGEAHVDVDAAPEPFAAEASGNVAALTPAPADQRPSESDKGTNVDLDAALTGAAGRGALASRRGGGLEGRSPAARAALLGAGGGDPGTEGAVARGLRWIAAHQQKDGGWNFDHHRGPCGGACRNPGTAATTTGATGIALLAFLGAGQTHQAGDYQETVRQGLYYLNARLLETPHGGDLQEGTMYGQALATWALSEAYAMTGDQELAAVAQQAVDFSVWAQDPAGGGWRYFPGQPGDTSVTGWQLLALKSADLAYLNVPPQTFFGAAKFLDGVQSDRGARYGYQSPEPNHTMTAVGVLCRMFSGWRRDEPAFELAAQSFAAAGPSPDNMYFNYYATQVMFHYGGPYWEAWNLEMKQHLTATQATRGHESGSWYFAGGQCEKGGRLLSTALCVLTLEVYYRYLPLYRPAAEAER